MVSVPHFVILVWSALEQVAPADPAAWALEQAPGLAIASLVIWLWREDRKTQDARLADERKARDDDAKESRELLGSAVKAMQEMAIAVRSMEQGLKFQEKIDALTSAVAERPKGG